MANSFLASHLVLVLLVASGLFISSGVLAYQIKLQSDNSGAQDISQPQDLPSNPTTNQPVSLPKQQTDQTTTRDASERTNDSSSSSPTNSPSYKPPVCTKIVIPYTTTFKLATYLGAGQMTSYGGTDGYKETCTADSSGYVPSKSPVDPVNKVISIGDGGGSLSVAPHPQSVPYEEAYSRALPACDEFNRVTNYDPAATQWCLNTVVAGIMHYYGY